MTWQWRCMFVFSRFLWQQSSCCTSSAFSGIAFRGFDVWNMGDRAYNTFMHVMTKACDSMASCRDWVTHARTCTSTANKTQTYTGSAMWRQRQRTRRMDFDLSADNLCGMRRANRLEGICSSLSMGHIPPNLHVWGSNKMFSGDLTIRNASPKSVESRSGLRHLEELTSYPITNDCPNKSWVCLFWYINCLQELTWRKSGERDN